MDGASPYHLLLGDTSPASLAAAVGATGCGPSEGVLLLLSEEGCPDLEELVRELAPLDVPFFGAVFPGLISGERRVDRGALVVRVPLLAPPVVLSDHTEGTLERLSAHLSDGHGAGLDDGFLLVLIDGLAPGVAGLLGSVYDRFGSALRYVGGGAGSLSFVQKPCLFTVEGVFQDAAILIPINLRPRTAVRHGWRRLQGPFVVTRSDRNRIDDLNWEPAGDVYAEVVESESGQVVTEDGFFDVAKGFPFGMLREGEEDVVRDPVARTPEGALLCVGEVPEHSVVHILKGEPDSLIAAAERAGRESATAVAGLPAFCLVADCISRTLFLGEQFDEELRAVARAIEPLGVPVVGALTLGEIASYGGGHLEFFNKTIVVAVLEEHVDKSA